MGGRHPHRGALETTRRELMNPARERKPFRGVGESPCVPIDSVPAIIAGIVATVCALLAFASWRALVRTGNRGIYYVVAAFSILALKNLVKAFTLGTTGETEATELVFSLLDLTAVALFAWPLLRNVGVPR